MLKLKRKALAWFGRQARKRRTIRELSELNDRELSDIGINRCDIYSVARGDIKRTWSNI